MKNCQQVTKRFSASGGVAPQTVMYKFGVFCPAIPTINHRLRQAAKTLSASGRQRGGQQRAND